MPNLSSHLIVIQHFSCQIRFSGLSGNLSAFMGFIRVAVLGGLPIRSKCESNIRCHTRIRITWSTSEASITYPLSNLDA
jgi:hypothetical protein